MCAAIAGLQDFRQEGPPGDIGVFQFPATVNVFQYTFSGTTYYCALKSDRGWRLIVPPNIDFYTVLQAAFNYLSTLDWQGGHIHVGSMSVILSNTIVVPELVKGFLLTGDYNFKTNIEARVGLNAPAFNVGSLGAVNNPVFSGFRFNGLGCGAEPFVLFTTNNVSAGANETLVEKNEFIGCKYAIRYRAEGVGMNYNVVRDNWLIGNTSLTGGALIDIPYQSAQVHQLWIHDNWFRPWSSDGKGKSISLGRTSSGPYKINDNEFHVDDSMVLHVYGPYKGSFNDNRLYLNSDTSTPADSRLIYINESTGSIATINDNVVYRVSGTKQCQYLLYLTHSPTYLTVVGNNVLDANFQQANPIRQTGRNYGRFVDNDGYNPRGLIATPFDNVNNIVTAIFGAAAGPTNASTDYVIDSIPCLIVWSAGTGVDVTIKDAVGGNVIKNPGATGEEWLEPKWAINFGAFSAPPTVKVAFK